MNWHHITMRQSKRLVSALLGIGASVLAGTIPALSQTPGALPIIVPASNSSSGATPTVTPAAPTVGKPIITPAPSVGQPIIAPIPNGAPTNTAPSFPTVNPPAAGQPQITPLPANLTALTTQWGLSPMKCQVGVATIRMADSVVCVKPTAQLPTGDYIYDPAKNQLTAFKAAAPFTFKNPRDYADCIEDILQLYQNKDQFSQQGRRSTCLADSFQASKETGFSAAQALKMIQDANFYATTLLSNKMFPPKGQRVRIAQTLGFIYEVDANDEMIRQAAAQATSTK